MILLLLAQLGGSTLNLNQQPIETRQNGGRLSTTRQYAIDCRTNMTCVVDGGVVLLSSSGGAGSGGAPVDAGYVVWSAAASTGSTNERALTAGNYTAINTGAAGQVKVNWTHGLTCTASQALTSSGADAMQCRQFGFSDLTGTASIAQGGTGVAARAVNDVVVGTGVNTTAAKTLPSCSNATTSKLLYDNATQTWSCGTDQTGGGSGGTSPYILSFGGF